MNTKIALAEYVHSNPETNKRGVRVPVCPYCGEQHFHELREDLPQDQIFGATYDAPCSPGYKDIFASGAYALQEATEKELMRLRMAEHYWQPWQVVIGPDLAYSWHNVAFRAVCAYIKAHREHPDVELRNERLIILDLSGFDNACAEISATLHNLSQALPTPGRSVA